MLLFDIYSIILFIPVFFIFSFFFFFFQLVLFMPFLILSYHNIFSKRKNKSWKIYYYFFLNSMLYNTDSTHNTYYNVRWVKIIIGEDVQLLIQFQCENKKKKRSKYCLHCAEMCVCVRTRVRKAFFIYNYPFHCLWISVWFAFYSVVSFEMIFLQTIGLRCLTEYAQFIPIKVSK